MVFSSEKTREILENQVPMDTETIEKVKTSLAEKGVVMAQTKELDKFLEEYGNEATTFSDGTIVLHTKVSASGFYEELIHYGQLKSGRVVFGNDENRLLMEIEAQERLIK
ncbi:MAG: hypothetical protein FWF94_01775, partial [Oscillospiraceae bacterium]|nr:hypothetical protein [Oscillospiraceae bacterium]